MSAERPGRPELAVIVCCYNGAARLGEFLPRLFASGQGADCRVELVVVDDGSTDGTSTVVPSLAPDATLVRMPRNGGLPAARNVGAASTSAPWLLYCDDDVVMSSEAISLLWAARQARTCSVPRVTGPDGVLQNSVTLEWHLGDPKFRFHDVPVEDIAYPMGSCFLVSREDYERAGGCDERFFPMYYDDAALGARLRRTGTRIAMRREITVVHYQHGNQPANSRLRTIEGWVRENRWVYALTQLRGGQRVITVSLGLPRVLAESTRIRSVGPLRGYAKALRRASKGFREGTYAGR
jgi:GT2 family glycosyltransferase